MKLTRILVTFCFTALVALSALAGSYTSTVTSVESPIVPPTVHRSVALQEWTNDTVYTRGTLASLDGTPNTPAMVVWTTTNSTVGLSDATAPTWSPSADIVDNELIWRPCPRRPRTKLVIANNTAQSSVYIDFWPDVAGGIPISASAFWELAGIDYCPQARVYARTGSAAVTGVVSIVDSW